MLPLGFAWLGALAFAGSLAYFLFAYFVTFGAPPLDSPVTAPIVIDVALFSIFALHHSLFARTRIKAWITSIVPPPLERAFYSWIASVLFIVVCAAWAPVPGVIYSIRPPWNWIGYIVQGAGVLVTFLGARSLDVLDLAGVRQVTQWQRPHPGTTAQVPLQTTGVYGVVRHPLYFGWAMLVFGAPHMTATRLSFAVVSTIYLAIAIPFEERGLDETFGPEYGEYRKHVRWRMLPGLY